MFVEINEDISEQSLPKNIVLLIWVLLDNFSIILLNQIEANA